jgi:hypothetical protein
MSSLSGEEVDNQVPSNPRQPAPERASVRVGVVALDGPGDSAEDFLDQVLSVGFLEPSPPGEPVHEWAVNLRELGPGALIAQIAEAKEKTGACARFVVHPVVL